MEQTFAWLKRYRRLTVDPERSCRSYEAMLRLAMIRVMLSRLCPPSRHRHLTTDWQTETPYRTVTNPDFRATMVARATRPRVRQSRLDPTY